jgi:hypothetical protein
MHLNRIRTISQNRVNLSKRQDQSLRSQSSQRIMKMNRAWRAPHPYLTKIGLR